MTDTVRTEVILTTFRRVIQCEKFIKDESASLVVYQGFYKENLCYARYEKPLKNHSLEVAKKYMETYSSSHAA